MTAADEGDAPLVQTGAELVRRLIATVGGRYSSELGIDLDAGGVAPDEWFCAATLFGTRISAASAVRTYRTLAAAGVRTVLDAQARSWDNLVALLDAGGYARYDFRTATRLQQLAVEVRERCRGTIATLATHAEPRALEAELDGFSGWGPTTVRIFLRELRDVWLGAQPPVDDRARRAARHLNLALGRSGADHIQALRAEARRAQVDVRDLETALVRLTLAHRDVSACPGGIRCRSLAGGPDGATRRNHRGSSEK